MFKLTIEEYVILTVISHGLTLNNSHRRIKPNLFINSFQGRLVDAECLYHNALLRFLAHRVEWCLRIYFIEITRI